MATTIGAYDPDCVHNFGDYRIAFNASHFLRYGEGRLELWKGDEYCGIAKGFLVVGLDLSDLVPIPRAEDHVGIVFPEEWLILLDRVRWEEGHQAALYEAAFEMASRLGAAGIVSEWDELESKRLWSELAPKFGATIKEHLLPVGPATNNPRETVPVYIALFPVQ